jgi:hypothetical protein
MLFGEPQRGLPIWLCERQMALGARCIAFQKLMAGKLEMNARKREFHRRAGRCPGARRFIHHLRERVDATLDVAVRTRRRATEQEDEANASRHH